MKKISIIIQREFLSRIRKRTFIIGTLLLPIMYIGLIFGTGYLAKKDQQHLHLAIIDSSGLFTNELIAKENIMDSTHIFALVKNNIKINYDSLGYDGFILIPDSAKFNVSLPLVMHTKKTYGLNTNMQIEHKLNNIWDEIKYKKLNIDTEKNAMIMNSKVNLKTEDGSAKKTDAGIAYVIASVCGFLMYLILLLYGSQVMMGVTEEKTSRIAEVVVSSVKPFQLMVGKIIGIGLVALVQFSIWILSIFLIYNIGKFSAQNSDTMSQMVGKVQEVVSHVNIPLIIGCFVFYLLGGFFFYASLYAAVGSAINEDMREGQSLSMPITMIVIFSIFIGQMAISNPNSSMAVWGSIIPFSSPIVMMARLPFGMPNTVPYWQLALSMITLVVGFLCTTWFAGKIYKTGILMYGKKPSWKEMIKWAFRK